LRHVVVDVGTRRAGSIWLGHTALAELTPFWSVLANVVCDPPREVHDAEVFEVVAAQRNADLLCQRIAQAIEVRALRAKCVTSGLIDAGRLSAKGASI
jgi:hypothetical protein